MKYIYVIFLLSGLYSCASSCEKHFNTIVDKKIQSLLIFEDCTIDQMEEPYHILFKIKDPKSIPEIIDYFQLEKVDNKLIVWTMGKKVINEQNCFAITKRGEERLLKIDNKTIQAYQVNIFDDYLAFSVFRVGILN
ncbi:MAG TPA: hypothetical protein PKD18_02820 [Saprospiraceae bacterium]|nr:hypothetical protein [Saprospiraceae bacterium]